MVDETKRIQAVGLPQEILGLFGAKGFWFYSNKTRQKEPIK
jgi:hypothetical protein